jgi:hypothetical protein
MYLTQFGPSLSDRRKGNLSGDIKREKRRLVELEQKALEEKHGITVTAGPIGR